MDFIKEPLSHTISSSLLEGVVPNQLKISTITPIPKVKNPTKAEHANEYWKSIRDRSTPTDWRIFEKKKPVDS